MNFIIFQLRRFLMFLSDAFMYPFIKIRELWSDPTRGRAMIYGLPALIVAFIGIAVVLLAMSSQGRFRSNYEIAKKRAEQDEKWGEAIVYMRKIMQLRANDDATKWELARVLAADQREETSELNRREAASIMLSLSPVDSPGYPKAHIWRAKQALNSANPNHSVKQKRALAEKQLRFALDTEPENEDALIMLAEQILIPEGKYEEALSIYVDLFEDYVGYYVKIAELNRALNTPEEAEPYLEDAIKRYTVLIADDPKNVDYLRRRANAYAMDGQHDVGAQSLIDAIAVAEQPADRKQLESALSRIYLAKAMLSAGNAGVDPEKQLAFIENVILAYQTDPENDAAKTSLARFGFAQLEHSQMALDIYDPRDNPEEATDIALQVAGTHEVVNGDRLLGIRLLELAIQKNPRNDEALNNLAFTIMDTDSQRALDLSNRAVGLNPRSAQYRDTRGNIYMRMGDWQNAIPDLQKAVNIKNNIPVYENLVKCFNQVNMRSSAASFQKKLDELRAAQQTPSESTDDNDSGTNN